MRISSFTITALCILFCGTVGLCNTQAADSSLQQRIQIQEQRLAEIDQAAASKMEQVEAWYADQRIALAQEIQQIARLAAIRLDPDARFLWVEFANIYRAKPLPDVYFVPEVRFNANNYLFTGNWETAILRNSMLDEYLVSETADLLLSEDFAIKLATIEDEGWQAPGLRDEARQLLRLTKQVRARARAACDHLEYRKSLQIDGIAQWERELKQQVTEVLEFLRRTGTSDIAVGTVLAVGCSAENEWVAEIEGEEGNLRSGDTVRGVKIVSINTESVQFAKNGTTWSQEIGAPASAHWD